MIKKIAWILLKIFLIILKIVIALALALIIGLLILKFTNTDIDISYEDGNIVVRKKVSSQTQYELNIIDDEYPNVSDYQEDSYFYLQLDDNAKAIYIAIKENLENMKSGTYKTDFGTRFNGLLNLESGQQRLSNSFQSAVNALKMDSPEVFFIDFSKVYLNTYGVTENGITKYTVYIDKGQNDNYFIDGFSSKSDIDKAQKQVQEVRDTIISNISEDSSNYEKILAVHDWLIDNLEYDETLEEDNRSNIYGALIERHVTCQGYAKAFKYIMDSLNVPCIVVKGDATNSAGTTEKHMWNYVQINNNWYGIDVTWDDPIIIGNGEISNDTKYKYFLKGKSFLENHTEDGSTSDTNVYFTYPELIDE